MAIRVGINGFGRIGRLVFRAGLGDAAGHDPASGQFTAATGTLHKAGWVARGHYDPKASQTFGHSTARGHAITVHNPTGKWSHSNATGREVASGVGASVGEHVKKLGLSR